MSFKQEIRKIISSAGVNSDPSYKKQVDAIISEFEKLIGEDDMTQTGILHPIAVIRNGLRNEQRKKVRGE